MPTTEDNRKSFDSLSGLEKSPLMDNDRGGDDRDLEKMHQTRRSVSSVHSMDSRARSSTSEEALELLEQDAKDLEGQNASEQQPTPTEYSTSTSRKLLFLGLYFIFNLSVTLSNKGLLKTVRLTIWAVLTASANAFRSYHFRGFSPSAIPLRLRSDALHY